MTDSDITDPRAFHDLVEARGIAGDEQAVLDRIEANVSTSVTETTRDGMGNLVCTIPGDDSTTIGVVAHVDEIGFIVRSITPDGFLNIEPVGSWPASILGAKPVLVHGSRGTIPGTIATQSYLPTADLAPTEYDNLYVDVGLDASQVSEQVSAGDYVSLDRELRRVGGQYLGHALDNRAGVYAVCASLRQLSASPHTITAVFSVQEELGARGVQGLSDSLGLDAALVIDATLANDTPVHQSTQTVTELGAGVGIKIKDDSILVDPAIREHIESVADQHGIPYQREILPGADTEAGTLQVDQGISMVGGLSIPTRYLHTGAESIHVTDLRATADLLVAILENAHVPS
jgi:endoglucanase